MIRNRVEQPLLAVFDSTIACKTSKIKGREKRERIVSHLYEEKNNQIVNLGVKLSGDKIRGRCNESYKSGNISIDGDDWVIKEDYSFSDVGLFSRNEIRQKDNDNDANTDYRNSLHCAHGE